MKVYVQPSPAEAARVSNPLGLLPLYDYCIVSKASAACHIVAHALMCAPTGVLAWLDGLRTASATAGAVALALIIESGRYLRRGREGDVTAVAVAARATYVTARAMPWLWSMFRRIMPSLG